MVLVERYSRPIRLITTLILSVSMLAAYQLWESPIVQWLLMMLIAGGIYKCVEVLLEQFLRNGNKQIEQTNSIFYKELFLKNDAPCLVVKTFDYEVVELNLKAKECLLASQVSDIKTLHKIFEDPADKKLTHWLRTVSLDNKYSNYITKVKILDSHQALIPKLATLTYIPIGSSDTQIGIIKVSVNTLVLSGEIESIKDIDIVRHSAGTAYWELDLTTNQLYFCDIVSRLLGLDSSFTSPIELLELQERADGAIFEFAANTLTQDTSSNYLQAKKMLIDRQGNQFFVLLQAQLYPTENTIVGTLLDMTEIKQAEVKLRQREQQMSQLIDSIPEGIMILHNSKVAYMNRASLKLFGFEIPSHALDKLLADFVSDTDKTLLRDRIKYMLAGKRNNYGFTSMKLKRIDGEFFDAEVAISLVIYEGLDSIQFVIRDLTDVLRVKTALARANFRLSALSSKTLELIEAERKQIAGELHDDVGQSLTAVLLATKWISRRLEDPKLLEKVSDIHQITSQSLDTVRNLSLLLRPAQLDSLGFSPAIRWQMDKLFSIDEIQYELDDQDFLEVKDKQAEIVGFRVVQESLTNIVKHARAKNVKVTLQSNDSVLIIHVSDDGKGFDVNAQSDSVGLINMKERVELAGGEFKVHSKLMLGTDIKVEIPLRNSASGLDF